MARPVFSFIDPLGGMGRGARRETGWWAMFREAPDGLIPFSDREPP